MKSANGFDINGRFLVQATTGVQRYAHEMLRALDAILEKCPLGSPVRLLAPANAPDLDLRAIEYLRTGHLRAHLWEQIELPRIVANRQLLGLCGSGPLWYRNQRIVVHDTALFAVPEGYSFFYKLLYRNAHKGFARHTRGLITVSQFSRDGLQQYLPLRSSHVDIVSPGSDNFDRLQADTKVHARLKIEHQKYIFTVGSMAKHKNLEILAESFRQYQSEQKSDIKLVIAGSRHGRAFSGNVALEGAEGYLVYAGYVTDEELKALYNSALCFVFPSLYEGYGLPLLEAMRCGCPVASSSAASLPEAAGGAALLFDPLSIEDIKHTLSKLCTDPTLRKDLIQRGFYRSGERTWRTAATELISIMSC